MERPCLSEEAQCGRPLQRAPLLGTPEYVLSKALARASVSTEALFWGNMEGCSFHWAFEIMRDIKRYVKMTCKQVSLSIRAPLGNLEGICLPGLFG
jgi:hypothetical protein